MAQNQFQLRVLTPNKTAFDGAVDFVLLRTSDGDMGILHGHEPCSVMLDFGVLSAYDKKEQVGVFAVLGGFAAVRDGEVVVLSPFAEAPENVEAALAKVEKERAENHLHEQKSDLEVHRAESALRRTLVQMEVSSYSLLKDTGKKPENSDEKT